MTNDFIDYYSKYKISPVKQDLTDMDKHFYIREMLYQALGVPATYFKDKNVVEIGPGGGYNAIVTSTFDPKYYQLIDANETGIKDIKNLFKKYNLRDDHVNIVNCFAEEFHTNREFDIAICENMLCCIKNNYEVLEKMDSLLTKNGIMIVSCADEISIFYDMTRRLFANILVQREGVEGFTEKVNMFVEAFSSHLKTLKGFYKIPFDWCADNLMGKALYNTSLAVPDLLEFFNDKYHFYQITPNIVVDEQWHKEIPLSIQDYNNRKKSLFQKTWHNIFHYQVMSEQRDERDNIELRKFCREYFNLIEKSEDNGYTEDTKITIINTLEKIYKNLENIDPLITNSLNEIMEFLKKDEITVFSISNDFKYFHSAFGKGQQYFSMIKKR